MPDTWYPHFRTAPNESRTQPGCVAPMWNIPLIWRRMNGETTSLAVSLFELKARVYEQRRNAGEH